MTKHIFILLNLLGLAFYSYAQDTTQTEDSLSNRTNANEDPTILRNIEVIKEYNPVIKEAGKISTMPELDDIPTPKRTYDFSVWTTPYSIKSSTLPTLEYAVANPDKGKSAKPRYARIGVGTYANILGELYTPFIHTNRNLFDLYLQHNSTFGKIKLTDKLYNDAPYNIPNNLKSKATHSDTKGKLSFTHSLKNKEISTFVAGRNNVFRYYGFDSAHQLLSQQGVKSTDNDSSKQAINQINANFAFRSKDFISKWKYDVQVDYNFLAMKDDLKENTIHTTLYGAYRFENSSLHLTFDMRNIIMSLPNKNDRYVFNKEENLHNYTDIKLMPRYFFSGDAGEITIGVNGAFNIGQGKKGCVTPNVYGKAKLIKNVMYLYAGVTGDYIVNNYQYMLDENLYISPNVRIEDTYIPIDAYIGTTLKIAKRVDMDFHFGYKLIENAYFFVNHSDTTGNITNTFDAAVCDKKAGVFNVGLALAYDWSDKLSLHFNGNFYKWALQEKWKVSKTETKEDYNAKGQNLKEPWLKPKWQMDFDATYKVTDALRISLGYQLDCGKKALVGEQTIKLRPTNNLTIGADYRLLNWLNVFVKFDNVLCQQYESWYGYAQQGFNFMGGATIIF